MAKALLVCFRYPSKFDVTNFVNKINKQLSPDNVCAEPPYVYADDKIVSVIYNPTDTIIKNGPNILLGLCDSPHIALEPSRPIPEGSFALFRTSEIATEIASDYAASRTIWYYSDQRLFLASTSQRMIVALLGNYSPNLKASAWFLSTGTLGPGLSWDSRLKILPPRKILELNRQTWTLKVSGEPNFKFDSNLDERNDNTNYKKKLQLALKDSVSNLNIDSSKWTLALSGGMDSRSLLYHLRHENLKSVTWGLSSSIKQKTSDAHIAKRLATINDLDNQYAPTDYRKNTFPTIVERFLCAGEGRIDHLAGYLDGLQLWAKLSESGRGVIRGYDAFGRKPPVTNNYQVRRTCNLVLSSDYSNNNVIPKALFIDESDLPHSLSQNDRENFESWRDRLWLQHRTPITTAALEDIKLSYVEVINPLLSRQMVLNVQQLPLELRNNKSIWKEIVSEMYPKVPFARREAVQEVGQVLMLSDVKECICDSILELRENDFFDSKFITKIVDNYNHSGSNLHIIRRYLRRLIIANMPKVVENTFRKKLTPDPLSNQWLALRVMLILKTHQMFNSDSRLSPFK